MLPFAKLRAWRASASSCTNELQRRQLPAAAEPEPEQAGSEAGQDSPATREVPPGYNSGVEQQRRTEFKRLQGRVYAGKPATLRGCSFRWSFWLYGDVAVCAHKACLAPCTRLP